MTTESTSFPGRAQDQEHSPISTPPFPDDTEKIPDAVPGESEPEAEQPAAPKQQQASGAKAVREIVETLLLAVIIFVAVRALVLNFRVDGSSMYPNLHNGEMLLVNRNVYAHLDVNKWLDYIPFVDKDGEHIVYLFHPPERGDIIVFNPPISSDKPYIKRVIAVAGDTVQVKSDGYVYVNDQKLEEDYIHETMDECGRSCNPQTVPDGYIYVLGDNRNNSSDSRVFGFVPIGNIIGKAWLTYWPLDDFGLVPHENYPDLGSSSGD
jgi:signal peptidase I